MFESRIRGKNWKITVLGKSSYFFLVLWNGKSCQEMSSTMYKTPTPCMDWWPSFQRLWIEIVCSRIVLKCFHFERIGRPDILWSVNKLARSITKWTKACDKRLNRLISYISHTCEYKQYCHVGSTAKPMQIGTVSRLRFCGRSWRSKIHFRRNIMRFWKSYTCSNKLYV